MLPIEKGLTIQKEPETTAMACGNMSGGNFFNNVRRASNAPLTVDQWRRPMARWLFEPVSHVFHVWPLQASRSQWLISPLRRTLVSQENSGRRVWPLPPTLSCQPCRCIHLLSKETGPLQTLPDQACLITESTALWSNVKRAETLPAWKYKRAAWPIG